MLPVVWDAPAVDWSRFDRVIIRSTWDYHLKPAAYERWLRDFLPADNQLWNPPTALLANLHKRYLAQLAQNGVNSVETAYVDLGSEQHLHAIIEHHRWHEVVIKPAISANALGTWKSSRDAARRDQERFASQTRTQDLLVQPYCPEIASKGEWSMIFFDGIYSHAVLKKPAAGEFRVQKHLGGTVVAAEPTARLIEQASGVLGKTHVPLLYARVDGIERDGDFILTELEINEPNLYLGLSEGAPARFAESIVSCCRW